jgi:hypothetical protein
MAQTVTRRPRRDEAMARAGKPARVGTQVKSAPHTPKEATDV